MSCRERERFEDRCDYGYRDNYYGRPFRYDRCDDFYDRRPCHRHDDEVIVDVHVEVPEHPGRYYY